MGIRYYLPETRVRLSGVIDHVTTAFDPGRPVTVSSPVSSAVEWVVQADQHWRDELSLDGGVLEERLVAAAVTADRRLTGASSSSTSQAAAVVKAAAKAVGVVAAVAGVLLTAGAPRGDDSAIAGYDLANPRASLRLAALRQQLVDGRTRLDDARNAYLAAATPEQRRRLYLDLVQMGRVMEAIEEDLDRALEAFRAWKASRTVTVTESVHTMLELRQLPWFDGVALDWTVAAPTTSGTPAARTFWERLGFVVARTGPTRQPTLAGIDGPGIMVRLPRLEAFALLRRNPGPEAPDPSRPAPVVPAPAPVVVEETFQRWVLDDRCDTEFVAFDRKLFGDREIVVGFDADGVLTSMARTSRDGTVPAIPAFADATLNALSTGRTARETIDGFTSHRAAARKARLATEVAIAEAEVELAELGATRAEAARLARLQQLADLADAYDTMAAAEPSPQR